MGIIYIPIIFSSSLSWLDHRFVVVKSAMNCGFCTEEQRKLFLQSNWRVDQGILSWWELPGKLKTVTRRITLLGSKRDEGPFLQWSWSVIESWDCTGNFRRLVGFCLSVMHSMMQEASDNNQQVAFCRADRRRTSAHERRHISYYCKTGISLTMHRAVILNTDRNFILEIWVVWTQNRQDWETLYI